VKLHAIGGCGDGCGGGAPPSTPALVARPQAPGVHQGARDAELAGEGWTRRFVASRATLDDHVALYESMGFEVLLEPVAAEDLSVDCGGCSLALEFYRILYTRRPS
jgi:hypothetical protein